MRPVPPSELVETVGQPHASADSAAELQAVQLADAFHYCYLLRHCCPNESALLSVVDAISEAKVPHSFHLNAALHGAYSQFDMRSEAAAALERLQHIFASLHASREAKIDEVSDSPAGRFARC